MPIRRFWMLHRNIDRISAEQDTRALFVAMCSQSGEASGELLERLRKRTGTVVEFAETEEGEVHPLMDTRRDQAGFDELKSMGRSL